MTVVAVPEEKHDLYIGLQSDAKPTAQVGARFIESDTLAEYIWDGANWAQMVQGFAKRPVDFVFAFMKDSGDGVAMNVDGSSDVKAFNYEVPAGKTFLFERVNVHIQDSSIRADGFGGLTILANGLLVEIIDTDGSTVVLDFTDGKPLKRHNSFGHLAGIDADADTSGVGGAQDSILIRWTINRAGASMLLHTGEIIRVTVQDDLTGLSHFRMMVQGVFE